MEQTIEKDTELTQLELFPGFLPEELKPLILVKGNTEDVKTQSKGSVRELPAGTELEIHPAAHLLPMQTKEDYERMREDIRHIGQTDPVELLNGKILDGRNRSKACQELGIPVKVVDVEIPEEKINAYIYSRNLHRRHLNKGQIAVMALEFLPELKREARGRQIKNLRAAIVGLKSSPTGDGRVAEILGRKVGVGKEYIKYAIFIQKKKPELLEKVLSGEMEISKAYSEARIPAVPVEKNVYLSIEQAFKIVLDTLPEEKNEFLYELAEQTNGKTKKILLDRTRRESKKLIDAKIDEIMGEEK